MIMEAVAVFQAWIWVVVHIGKSLIYSQVDKLLDYMNFSVNLLSLEGALKM
jgi:hypothetical protein